MNTSMQLNVMAYLMGTVTGILVIACEDDNTYTEREMIKACELMSSMTKDEFEDYLGIKLIEVQKCEEFTMYGNCREKTVYMANYCISALETTQKWYVYYDNEEKVHECDEVRHGMYLIPCIQFFGECLKSAWYDISVLFGTPDPGQPLGYDNTYFVVTPRCHLKVSIAEEIVRAGDCKYVSLCEGNYEVLRD